MNDRRRFLAQLGGMTVLVSIGAAACDGGGDDDDDTFTPVTCAGSGGAAVAISGNHGHAVTIPQGHINNATEQTYSIMGGGDHDHEITVTAAMFAQIAAGEAVTVSSTNTGHGHSVTLQCNAA